MCKKNYLFLGIKILYIGKQTCIMEHTVETSLPHRRRTGIARRILTIIFLVLLLGAALFIWWRYYYTYSDGFRFGLLQKFSRRGTMFKTNEGEMILSSVRGNANVPIASEKFYFSVTDDSVAQKLMNLQGHSVTVRYKEKNSAVFWRGDSQYIVDSVRLEQ
ncbi:MAG: hypothetical protein JWR72_18 [Flavisolibacter sp.]|jgi:hypothetical protein|nr:hypothetical protein [Flavisolibacter sp.]